MVLFAIIGVVVNGYAAWKMSGGASMNERVITWHLLEDVLGWVAILLAAVVLLFKDVPHLDPALSLFITLFILWNVFKRLKETLFIFLQGVPSEVNIDELEQKILDIPQVESIHHTHIWSLDGEHNVFTTHVKLHHFDNLETLGQTKQLLKDTLHPYSFEHCTIETEMHDEICALVECGHEH